MMTPLSAAVMVLSNLLLVLLLTVAVAQVIQYTSLTLVKPQGPSSGFWRHLDQRLLALLNLTHATSQSSYVYFVSILVFGGFSTIVSFCLLSWQQSLRAPGLALPWHILVNIAVSFVTGTNWQAYSGEIDLNPLTQMMVLTWQQFAAPATGIASALYLIRGLASKANSPDGLGNFWVDMTRICFYVLLPWATLASLLLLATGSLQTFAGQIDVLSTNNVLEHLPAGPITSQSAIKLLGSNGGGYLAANSAHPFDNPNYLSHLIQLVLMLVLPLTLVRYFGQLIGNHKHAWALLSVMIVFVAAGAVLNNFAEAMPSLEGKELRFAGGLTALFNTLTTATSCGANVSALDSSQPLTVLVMLLNMQLGEVIFGGAGTGLTGMIVLVIMTVFLAGLMVGRSPEYLGKKIEPKEMTWATLAILIGPGLTLLLSALAVLDARTAATLGNPGPRGLSEIIYAMTSTVANNGSTLAGLNIASPLWTGLTTIAMVAGRYLPVLPVLVIGESMARKKAIPPNLGTFPTDGWLFAILLSAVMLLVGLLTYLPVLFLAPILEIAIQSAAS